MIKTDSASQKNVMKKSEENEKIELYISDLWRGLIKFWWVCVALAVVFAGIMFLRSYLRFTPRYTASATFTVQTQDPAATGNGISAYSFYYNRTTADQLSDTFPFILESNLLQETICEDLGVASMPASISATSVTGTNMFTMTANGRDPQATYDTLLSAIKNYPTVAEFVIGSTKLTMISEPVLPEEPSNKPSYLRRVIFGAGFGALIGIAFIILYALFRNTVRTKQDIKEKLNQFCLGVIPAVTFKKHNREINRSMLITNNIVGDGFQESMRALRNSVIQAAGDQFKVIMVSGTAPGEGKTTVSANLAASLAKVDKKVVLVECDLRNPSLKRLFASLNNDKIVDNKDFTLEHIDDLGIDFINFKLEENSVWNFMRTSYLSDLFGRLRKKYDFIIVDTSPCALTTDPIIVAQAADAAVLVIRQDTIRITRIKYAIENLRSVNVKMLGCVLNGASSGIGGYGESYGYKYGRYGRYGYGKYGYGKYGYGKDKTNLKNG